MSGFYVNQLLGLAAAKIFCSLSGCMLVESSGDIDSDTGVEGVVGTEDDINEPVHESIMPWRAKQGWLCVVSRADNGSHILL